LQDGIKGGGAGIEGEGGDLGVGGEIVLVDRPGVRIRSRSCDCAGDRVRINRVEVTGAPTEGGGADVPARAGDQIGGNDAVEGDRVGGGISDGDGGGVDQQSRPIGDGQCSGSESIGSIRTQEKSGDGSGCFRPAAITSTG